MTAGVLVASEVLVDGRGIDCPAAELLAGDLRRRGFAVDVGTLRPDEQPGRTTVIAPVPVGEGGVALAIAADDGTQQAAAEVVDTWRGVAGPRTVLLASPRSFCAGVDRAIEIVLKALEKRRTPVYVRKQIVHNTHVVKDLERRGAHFVDELDQVPDGATVVFSAHGVSPAVREEANARGLDVIDGTCPLVTKVHAEVVDALRTRFPALREPASEDICHATTNRQDSLKHVAADADLVLVVGSTNSSNSVRLVELARRDGKPAHLIDSACDIRAEWLAGVTVVGLTAGASAPPELVFEVIAALGGLGDVTVEERETLRESVHFGLSATLRNS